MMVVKCRYNRPSEISDEQVRQLVLKYVNVSELEIVVGKEYVVYGMTFRDGVPWYYLCTFEDSAYPTPQFAGFFEIVDPTFSRTWRLSWAERALLPAAVLPEAWASMEGFYEQLIDGGPSEEHLFQQMKSDIDEEAGSH